MLARDLLTSTFGGDAEPPTTVWTASGTSENENAQHLLARLDRFIEQCGEDGWRSLVTIELDAEAGRFPELLCAFFSASAWNYATRFAVAPLLKAGNEEQGVVGALTWEAKEVPVGELLRLDGDGVRWAANLRIAGANVRAEAIDELLRGSLFDVRHIKKTAATARCCWTIGTALDSVHLWIADDEIGRMPKF